MSFCTIAALNVAKIQINRKDICSLHVLFSVVGTPDERTGFDVLESHTEALILQHCELVGRNETIDGKVRLGRLEVLAEGENVAPHSPHISHHFDNLVRSFADPEHQSGFGNESPSLRPPQQLQRPLVLRLRANDLVHARHTFEVMIQDVGEGIEDDIKGKLFSLKIGNQYFDFRPGIQRPDLADGFGEDLRAAIVQLVAIHRRDHRMAQTHKLDRPGNPYGFAGVQFRRPAGFHCAESAAASTHIAQDHKRRRSMVPALAHVGTTCFFADGMKILGAHQILQTRIVLPSRDRNLQPFRPGKARRVALDGVRCSGYFLDDKIHYLRIPDFSILRNVQTAMLKRSKPYSHHLVLIKILKKFDDGFQERSAQGTVDDTVIE